MRVRVTDLSGREVFRKVHALGAGEHALDLLLPGRANALHVLDFQAGPERQSLLIPSR